MKKNIHPKSTQCTFTCGNCENEQTMASTSQLEGSLDVCSNCHPAYTGKIVKDAAGDRTSLFNKRYGK